MRKENQKYLIGVDGGGTKTIAALADLKGKILRLVKTGPSSFIKVGLEETIFNITKGIEKLLNNNKKKQILSTFIGLAAIEEQKEMGKVIIENLRKQSAISRIFKGEVVIGSDQIIGFRSGTDQKDGLVLIAGTGSASHGWHGKKEATAGGGGWLNDEGSAFWVGQRAYQLVLKYLDGRGEKTLMKNLFFKKFKAKKIGDLKKKIYLESNLIRNVSSLSLIVDKATQEKDRAAINLLVEAGQELSLAGKTVIKKLNLQKKKFPIVLIGSMFKSKIVLETVKKEIKKFAPKTEFIGPQKEPVIGAVKLALEQLKNR